MQVFTAGDSTMRLTRAATYGISTAAYVASAPAGEIVSNMTICNAYQPIAGARWNGVLLRQK